MAWAGKSALLASLLPTQSFIEKVKDKNDACFTGNAIEGRFIGSCPDLSGPFAELPTCHPNERLAA